MAYIISLQIGPLLEEWRQPQLSYFLIETTGCNFFFFFWLTTGCNSIADYMSHEHVTKSPSKKKKKSHKVIYQPTGQIILILFMCVQGVAILAIFLLQMRKASFRRKKFLKNCLCQVSTMAFTSFSLADPFPIVNQMIHIEKNIHDLNFPSR